MNSWEAALGLFRRGQLHEAEIACKDLLARAENPADALALLADIQLSSGRVEAAIVNLRALTELRPADAANQRRLGGALLSVQRTAEAAEILRRAVELEPGSVRGHNNLGQALLQTGDNFEAIQHFERALELNPSYAIGHHNLGLAYIRNGEYLKAVDALRRAIDFDASLVMARLSLAAAYEQMDEPLRTLEVYDQTLALFPRNFDALVRHGALLAKLHRQDAALESFDLALMIQPEDAITHASKASVLLATGRADEALQSADHALHCRTDFAEALNLKAAALCKLNRPREALAPMERALQLERGYVEGWCTSALVHQNLGDDEATQRAYREALSLDPGCLSARLGLLAALIPPVPASSTEDHSSRIAFSEKLAAFEDWLGERDLRGGDAWTLAKQPLFYLSYQEQPNKTLLQRFRSASVRCVAKIAGADQAPPASGAETRRFRLAIVSAHVFDHAVFNAVVQGWLRQLDRREFEITLFSLGTRQDLVTEEARTAVDHFYDQPRTIGDWSDLIRRHGPDAVIFPEIGMDPTTLALANLRLAPRQFAAWGHPETTGLPTIDYFLSAEAFEPVNAADHYSERLIRLPNLGVHYRPYDVVPAAVNFADLGISADGPVFVCPGTPFKYRPEHDFIFTDIAHRLGNCTFIFFKHDKVELSNKLKSRIAAVFERSGLDAGRHLAWIPWQPRPAFIGLLQQADACLDTIGFSGFNTLMQAVQAHLPCVTYEGRFMRGRFGSGILRQLGLADLVASSLPQYMDLAVRLALDPVWRGQLRDQLQLNEHQAYSDAGAVDALARVLMQSRSGLPID